MRESREVKQFWRDFIEETGRRRNTEYLECFHFELTKELANSLLAQVLSGVKTASVSSYPSYELNDERLPEAGDLSIITDWDGHPRCVIENTNVTILPFKDINYDHCRREGTSDYLESWRAERIKFFEADGRERGYDFTMDMKVVFVEFKVVYRDPDYAYATEDAVPNFSDFSESSSALNSYAEQPVHKNSDFFTMDIPSIGEADLHGEIARPAVTAAAATAAAAVVHTAPAPTAPTAAVPQYAQAGVSPSPFEDARAGNLPQSDLLTLEQAQALLASPYNIAPQNKPATYYTSSYIIPPSISNAPPMTGAPVAPPPSAYVQNPPADTISRDYEQQAPRPQAAQPAFSAGMNSFTQQAAQQYAMQNNMQTTNAAPKHEPAATDSLLPPIKSLLSDPRQKSALELAFVGDAVYEMLVREHVASAVDTSVSNLHNVTVSYVCAEGQSKALEVIQDNLSDEEKDIVRRGRNANKTAVPRNGNPRSYRSATGLEALFGYLHLLGEKGRINELFAMIMKADIPNMRDTSDTDVNA